MHLTIPLAKIMEDVKRNTGLIFNAILVNEYTNGNDYISAHSDDERGLRCKDVVGMSLGATRKFRIRHKLSKKIAMDIDMGHGDVVWMKPQFQKLYTHEIPVQKKVKNARISLTFRDHYD